MPSLPEDWKREKVSVHENDTFAQRFVSWPEFGTGVLLRQRGINGDLMWTWQRRSWETQTIIFNLLTKSWHLRPLLVQLRLPHFIAQLMRSLFACALA